MGENDANRSDSNGNADCVPAVALFFDESTTVYPVSSRKIFENWDVMWKEVCLYFRHIGAMFSEGLRTKFQHDKDLASYETYLDAGDSCDFGNDTLSRESNRCAGILSRLQARSTLLFVTGLTLFILMLESIGGFDINNNVSVGFLIFAYSVHFLGLLGLAANLIHKDALIFSKPSNVLDLLEVDVGKVEGEGLRFEERKRLLSHILNYGVTIKVRQFALNVAFTFMAASGLYYFVGRYVFTFLATNV